MDIIHLMLEEGQILSVNVWMRNGFAQNFSLGGQQVKWRREDWNLIMINMFLVF